MPASSSSGDPIGSTLPRVSGEIVHEQTVRAPIPGPPAATETTVRAPMPTLPQEQTVRAFVPSAVPGGAAASTHEVEELEEVDVEPEAETIDPQVIDVGALVSELEAHARGSRPDRDAPVSRADQITVPEAVAKPSEPVPPKREPRPRARRPRPEGAPPRPEPPAVSGEVSVSEPEPGGIFDAPAPRRDDRARAAAPARAALPRRDEPPAVSGEVAVAIESSASPSPEVPAGDIRVMPTMTSSGPQPMMTSSGPQPMMTSSGAHSVMTGSPQSMMSSSGSHPIMLASGPQPLMASSGSHPIMAGPPQASRNSSGSHPVMTISGASPVVPRRAGTDPGYMGKDSTGPQPRGQAETTGPHPVMPMRRRGGESSRDSLVLWVLAGALVVLALGVVMMVISWAQ